VRVVVVGAGGVGAAIARAAAASDVFERVVVGDIDGTRAGRAVERCADDRFAAATVDASNASDIAALARAESADAIVNACDPRFDPPIFAAAFDAECHYVDMAMTLSQPHPERPYEEPGVMLGAEQFAASDRWRERGLLALVGMGVEPGLSDVFARYAGDHLFSAIDEIGVRDGSDLVVEGYDFAPTFSVWTSRGRGLRLRADLLGVDDDRGVPEPAARLGARPRLVHDRAVLGARDVHVPGRHRRGAMCERRARGGAPDPAVGAVSPGDLQVRTR
jgi:hypothetical protein